MDVRVLQRYGLVDFDEAFNIESRYLGFVNGRRTSRKLHWISM